METKEMNDNNNLERLTDKTNGDKTNENDIGTYVEYLNDGIGKLNEEPMDLTFTNNKPFKAIVMEYGLNKHNIDKDKGACFNLSKIIEMRNYMMIANNTPKKRRGRKRKCDDDVEEDEAVNSLASGSQHILTTPPDCKMQIINSKEAEVLKAAKSLFSKRTQTLYHWLYPNTPKSQLKTAVAVSWETLDIKEKEFYISQVLGRFGFPQSSLMVNPQLGCMRLQEAALLPPLDLTKPTNLIQSHNLNKPSTTSSIQIPLSRKRETFELNKKIKRKTKGKIGRPCKNKLQNMMKDDNILHQIENENQDELFRDDPELRKEFAQFKWSLHLH